MDSQRRTGRGSSNRITRSWYPGDHPRSRRGSAGEDQAARSRGTSGLGTHVGQRGRLDSQGELDAGAGFLEPQSPFRWRPVIWAVRRLLPLCAAALVGAVTALAWQSFLVRPLPPPATAPALPAPTPAAQQAPQPFLLGSPPPLPASEISPAVEPPRPPRRSGHQAPAARPRAPSVKLPAAPPARPPAIGGRPARSPDPDAILRPAFL